MLGPVQVRVREPAGARHGLVRERRTGVRLGGNLEVIPDRAPEGVQIAGRPAQEVVVSGEAEAALAPEPVEVGADAGRGPNVGVGRPEDRRRWHPLDHARRPSVCSDRCSRWLSPRRSPCWSPAAARCPHRRRWPSSGCPTSPGRSSCRTAQPTLQALAADLDADGAPEVVRLVGGDNGAAWIEAWADGADGWRLMTAPALAVPGRAGQAELAFVGRPVRLLLRRADGEERVTLVRQPDFAEPDDPEECCLLLDDLVLAGNSIRLAPVADPGPVADTVHAIDLDGDGTDELLVTYFLSPLERRQQPDRGAGLPLGRGSLRGHRPSPGCRLARAAPPSSSATATASRATRPDSSAARRSTPCSGSASVPTTR